MLNVAKKIINKKNESGNHFSSFDPSALLEVCRNAFKEISNETRSLIKLLDKLQWVGEPRHLAEALPHFMEKLDLSLLIKVMHELHYQHKEYRSKLAYINHDHIPCYFQTDNGEGLLITDYKDDAFEIYFSNKNETEWVSLEYINKMKVDGTVYYFHEHDEVVSVEDQNSVTSFTNTVKKFKSLILQATLISFFINAFYLIPPFFIKSIYDTIIPSNAFGTLIGYVTGIIFAVAALIYLTQLKNRIILYIGARIDVIIGNNLFKHLLYLPAKYTEGSSISAQVSRFKDFDNAREFIVGPIISLILDLPFVFLFLGVIFAIGGWLGLIPVVTIIILATLAYILVPIVRNYIRESSNIESKRQEFLIEAFNNMHVLHDCSLDELWQKRFQTLMANSSYKNFQSIILTNGITIVADVLMIAAGLAVIAFGVAGVFNNTLTIGSIIATMMLIWRVLTPIKNAFSMLIKFTQVFCSIKQLDALLKIETEKNIKTRSELDKKFKGNILLNKISLRYHPQHNPALIGVSFGVKQGEVLAIAGPNGSGKSSIFKLLLGLHQPQLGNIIIDNMDIRQIDPIELRNQTAYVPQEPQLFYGTVAQNLRMTNPVADHNDLKKATQIVGIYDEICRLPNGFESRIRDNSKLQFSTAFQKKLSLARAYLKNSSIMLIDDQGDISSDNLTKSILNLLKILKKKVTVIIITNDRDVLSNSDRILFMQEGQVVNNISNEEWVKKYGT